MRNLGRTFGQLHRLFGAERRWRWLLLVALALVVTTFEVAGAALVFLLLGMISAPGEPVVLPVLGPVADLLPSATPADVVVLVATAVGVFFVARLVVLVARGYIQSRLVNNAGALLSDDLLRAYLAMPYVSHTRRNSAELVRNVYDSTQAVVRQALRPVVDIVAETLVVGGLLVVLVTASPLALVLSVAVLGPTIWVLQAVIQPRMKRLGRTAHHSRSDALRAIQQSLGGIRDVKLVGGQDVFAEIHLRERFRQARATYLARTLSVLPRAMIETALILTIVVVLIVAVRSGTDIQQVVPTLGLFAYVGLRLQPSLQKIVEGLNELEFSTAAIDDLVDDLRGRSRGGSHPPRAATPFRDRIVCAGMSFTYGDAATPALRDVDLTIRRGEFVGICGPTGGGKSTLVDLLTGLLEPTEGSITIDDRPLGPEPAWWWDRLGVVSQSVFLIDDTIRANVAFGVRSGAVDEERLREAVHRAQLDDVVKELPEGLDTRVGERGVQLSGGQRQRVAVARALYRDADVLVFDEGTSALDVATESALVAAIEDVHRRHTLVVVAHRISTVRAADAILVVADGRIRDRGSYDELLRDSPLFRTLV